MKRVVVFGTFDLFHKGHEHFLHEARTYGDVLSVVVARDETVCLIKGHPPQNNEEKRKEVLTMLPFVDEVHLGYTGDKFKIIEELSPDVICLGYDQTSFTEHLEKELAARELHPQIVRLTAHHPEKYKSSIIRKDF